MKTISEKNVSMVNQFTLENLVNGRAWIEGQGWQDIKVDEDFYNKSINQLVDLIGGREKTKQQVRFNLRNTPFHHWSANRFIYSLHRNVWEYVAGQDYTSEMATIRNHVKK